MSLNTTNLYYDLQHHVWFDPYDGYKQIDYLPLYKRDSIEIQVQAVINQYGFVPNSDGTAPVSYAEDLSDLVNITLGIKTRANYASEDAFVQSFIAFDSANSWHSPINGRFAIPVAIVGSVSAGSYLAEFHFYKSSGAVTTFGRRPLGCPIVQDLVTGQEPTPTPKPSNIGTATILSGTDSVVVSFTGMAATGLVFPSWIGAPQSTLGAIAGNNQFTIYAGGAVSGDTQVGYNVQKIS